MLVVGQGADDEPHQQRDQRRRSQRDGAVGGNDREDELQEDGPLNCAASDTVLKGKPHRNSHLVVCHSASVCRERAVEMSSKKGTANWWSATAPASAGRPASRDVKQERREKVLGFVSSVQHGLTACSAN